MQVGDKLFDLRNALTLCLCKRFDIRFVRGNELVERGIEETDRNRIAAECFEQALEVGYFGRIMELADKYKALGVRTNADTPVLHALDVLRGSFKAHTDAH